jgi:ATP-dependent Clp protease ATP-binding subunit ClpX
MQTVLTEAGYVGEDVESILPDHCKAADLQPRKAQNGIVFIDEIDKLRRAIIRIRGRKWRRVQQALLKLLEGTTVNVPPKES